MSADPAKFLAPTDQERDDLLDVAWQINVDENRIDDNGKVSGLHANGTYGGLRSARWFEARSGYVAIYRPTDEEASSARRYHDHCREHGYPAGDDVPAPLPRANGVYVGLTWTDVRRELRGEGNPAQLDLLGAGS